MEPEAFKTTAYSSLPASEDNQGVSLTAHHLKSEISVLVKVVLGASIALIIISVATLWLAVEVVNGKSTYSHGGTAGQKVSLDDTRHHTLEPVFPGLASTSFAEVEFDGRLRDNNSIYRMPPSPAVDAAWDEVSAEGFEAMTVPASMIIDSKKNPKISLKAPSVWGYGDDAYVVQIDVFHQIHCLNELRKEIYYDYYYDRPPSALHRDHKSHCIHMLLQNLMCHADLDIITHNWVHNDQISDPKERPFPDFNLVKQCRDFNATLRWAKDNAIRDLPKVWNALRIPPGMETVPGDGYA